MDEFKAANYKLKARLIYLEKMRQEFEAWVGDILRKVYLGDYQNIRLSNGDGGLDGIIFSRSAVVAVYAPRHWTGKEFATKVASDFKSGIQTFNKYDVELQEWIFIDNDPDDLASEVAGEVLKFKKANPSVRMQFWDFDSVWLELVKLNDAQLVEVLGNVPSSRDLEELELPDISKVIDYLSSHRSEGPAVRGIEIPDPSKLEYNKLTETKKDLLRAGRSKHALVEEFVECMPDPTIGNRVADKFQDKYSSLVKSGCNLDNIFDELWKFAGGLYFTGPDHVAAVAAILSYFFHRCDIFENPPGSV